MPDAKFDETLEAVFEERAREFSPHLREMLEQLWLEGVKEGRSRGLLESSQLENRLEKLSNIHAHSRIVTRADLEFFANDRPLELDDMLEAVHELERQGIITHVHDELTLEIPDFTRQEIMGEWVDEVASWSSQKTNLRNSPASSTRGSSRRSVTDSINHDESDKS